VLETCAYILHHIQRPSPAGAGYETLNVGQKPSFELSSAYVMVTTDCLLYVGGIPQIHRANADEFIHIFVNNSKKLTEFLEHMVKVCSYRSQSYEEIVLQKLLVLYSVFVDSYNSFVFVFAT